MPADAKESRLSKLLAFKRKPTPSSSDSLLACLLRNWRHRWQDLWRRQEDVPLSEHRRQVWR
jgi:hypothetical protein